MKKDAKSTVNELEQAVRDTISDITEVLAKSGFPMGDAKEDEHSEDQKSEKMEKMDPQDSLSDEEYESPAAADEDMNGDQDFDPDSDMGEEGSEDHMAEMQEAFQDMSDEELDLMIQYLQQEKESRSSQMDMGDEGMDQGMDQESAPEMEKAYKEDYLKLTKSIESIASSVEKLSGNVNKIATEVNTIKNKKPSVSAKAAVAQRTDALTKSDRAPAKMERLNKSETVEFLMGEIRQRNPLVNSSVISDLTYIGEGDELASFQDSLIRKGVKFPTL